MRRYVDRHADVIGRACHVVEGCGSCIAAAIPRIDGTRGVESHDVGKAGVGGLRAVRDSHMTTDRCARRRGIEADRESSCLRREECIDPSMTIGRGYALRRDSIHRQRHRGCMRSAAARSRDGQRVSSARSCGGCRNSQCGGARATCDLICAKATCCCRGQTAHREIDISGETVDRAHIDIVSCAAALVHGLGTWGCTHGKEALSSW